MPDFMSLLEAAAKFRAAAHDIEEAGPLIVRTACQMVAAHAKQAIGTYGLGWPSLAESTLAHKSANTPLLETGEMRNSIKWQADGLVGHVGSNLDRAVWQELGTSRGIPPRSFLMASAIDQGPKIAKMAGAVVRAAFAGHGPMGSRMHEILHALHIIKGFVDDIADNVGDLLNSGKRR